jgi:excisionase family DNA binding protein
MQSRTFFAQFIAALARDTPAYTATVSQPARADYVRGHRISDGSYVRGYYRRSSRPEQDEQTPRNMDSIASATPPHETSNKRSRHKEEAETGVRARPLPEVRFFTVAETAQAMGVSKMTVYRLVHSGELPAVRIGRTFRVPAVAVDDYLRDAYLKEA